MTPDDARRRHQSTRVHANKWGYRGVEWNAGKGKFRAVIWPVAGRRGRHLGWHGTAEEAAIAYDEAARKAYGRDAYLNFPREGENGVVGSLLSEGLCPNGHDLEEHGQPRANGRGMLCRKCNAEAASRYYRRKCASIGRADPR